MSVTSEETYGRCIRASRLKFNCNTVHDVFSRQPKSRSPAKLLSRTPPPVVIVKMYTAEVVLLMVYDSYTSHKGYGACRLPKLCSSLRGPSSCHQSLHSSRKPTLKSSRSFCGFFELMQSRNE